MAPHVQNNHNNIINAKRSYRIFRTYSGVLDNNNSLSTSVFLNRPATAQYRALVSIIPGPGINYTGPREAWGNYNMLQDFISPVDK